MEDIRKTTKMQKQINGKTYNVEVEVIRRKHLTGGTEFKINVTIKHDGHEVHDTAVELAVFKDVAEMFSPDKLAEEENAGYTEGPNKLIKVLRHDGAWTIARAKVEDRFFEINVKHFEEPSRFGIKNGRISKLWIREEGKTEADVSYDRGWETPETRFIYHDNMRLIGIADMAAGIELDRPHRCSGVLAYHVSDVMWSILESIEQRQVVTLESTCARPAPLREGLAPGELD